MHHTSHIPDYWVELAKVGIGFTQAADQQTTLNAIRREKKLSPGTSYEYCNWCPVLLAAVVERVSGTTLPTYLADHFSALGLKMVVAPAIKAPDVALSYDDNVQVQQPGWTAYGYSSIIATHRRNWPSGATEYRAGDIIQADFAVGAVDEGAGEKYAAGMDIQVHGGLNHTGRIGGYVTDFTISGRSGDRDRRHVQRPHLAALAADRCALEDLGPDLGQRALTARATPQYRPAVHRPGAGSGR